MNSLLLIKDNQVLEELTKKLETNQYNKVLVTVNEISRVEWWDAYFEWYNTTHPKSVELWVSYERVNFP